MLTLFWRSLPAETCPRQEGQHGGALRRTEDVPHRLANLDATASLCHFTTTSKTPRPACQRGPGLRRFGQGSKSSPPCHQGQRKDGQINFPSRSDRTMIGHSATGANDASWDRMEGWGSDFVAMVGGQRARPAEKCDHSIAKPDTEQEKPSLMCIPAHRECAVARSEISFAEDIHDCRQALHFL